MPKVERCFYKIKKLLKENKLLDKCEYDMDQIYQTIHLKNVPKKPQLITIDKYEFELFCSVCGNNVLKEYHFCPECSQRLK